MSRKIITFVLVIAIFISTFGLVASAGYSSVPLNLWERYILDLSNHYDDWDIFAPFNNLIATFLTDNVCSASKSDNYHYADGFISSGHDDNGYYLNCQCIYCNDTFKYYSDDLAAQYDAEVAASGLSGIDNTGKLIFYPPFSAYLKQQVIMSYGGNSYKNTFELAEPASITLLCTNVGLPAKANLTPTLHFQSGNSGTAPVSGLYILKCPSEYSISMIYTDGSSASNIVSYTAGNYTYSYSAGASIGSFSVNFGEYTTADKFIYQAIATFQRPYFEITPSGQVNTPANITNNITNVYSGNNTYNNIVNTTNNTYYDVGTGELIDIISWQFDYMNREYKLQLDRLADSLVTVKFGLDNLTVSAGTTVNNYYYGYDQCEPSPSHTHSWTSTVVSERTCTIPGITTYTCEECNQTYTDVVPAIGHIWDEGVHHDAVVDPDTEEITTPGYTTYTCTACGATQDVTDGAAPPSSADNSDLWWDKLLKWLAQFKTDLFAKLDDLNISDDDTTNITIDGDNFTFNDGDDEDSFDFKQDFLAKFGIIKELWDVGQYVVNIVSADAAYAYNFDINDALAIDTSGGGETTP